MAWLVTHQDSVLVCSGLCLLVRVSHLASDFSLSRSPLLVSGARIPELKFVSGPSGVVLAPVVTPKA